jgi:hypothetical protein
MDHPAYSPDSAPGNFHLFKDLENALRGKRFETNDEVKFTWENRPESFVQKVYKNSSQAMKNV